MVFQRVQASAISKMNKLKNNMFLKQNVDLIKFYEENKVSANKLMEKFECGKTQVYGVLKLNKE